MAQACPVNKAHKPVTERKGSADHLGIDMLTDETSYQRTSDEVAT
jgi:hypothetical protein